MAGHSKWNNIKNKKEKTDAQRAKIFTKIGREIMVAVKEGGIDPSTNNRLRDLIAKSRANNVPMDNVDRLIKKAAGEGDKNSFETCVYEGYGPNGTAVMVECLTDNRNRTAGEIRHYFDKSGGNLGTNGCVAFMFSLKGIIILYNEDGAIDEDVLMEHALEAGGEDVSFEEGSIEIETDPSEVGNVAQILREQGYNVLSAEAEQIPDTYTQIEDELQIKKMEMLLEMLEENDDVQNVWHNWEEK